jgi:hypothetical protein
LRLYFVNSLAIFILWDFRLGLGLQLLSDPDRADPVVVQSSMSFVPEPSASSSMATKGLSVSRSLDEVERRAEPVRPPRWIKRPKSDS